MGASESRPSVTIKYYIVIAGNRADMDRVGAEWWSAMMSRLPGTYLECIRDPLVYIIKPMLHPQRCRGINYMSVYRDHLGAYYVDNCPPDDVVYHLHKSANDTCKFVQCENHEAFMRRFHGTWIEDRISNMPILRQA